uniref:Palmitoyltransferase n=1 Tax=Trichobilharzia regenti TaxID=157069 RepID=A0AA85IPE2_TRIRE|nr:unnamed protein product [Trichobilharzia regenti]
MDYIINIIIYLGFCTSLLLFYCLRDTLIVRVMKTMLMKPFYVIWSTTIPLVVRKMIGETIHWFLFERHCVYQVIYLSCIIIGHYILIIDVITVLYRYSWLENNIFLGTGCLFFNGLLYMLLCFSDPGFINSRNKSVYAHIYEYDNFIYTPKQCTVCCHLVPARAKHCFRCDHCIFRFDHHCVWTNCCIGGQNHGLFITFLFSLCLMIGNAIWLCCRMLYTFTIHENLWQAHYLDEYDQTHPMDWLTLSQHLFVTFPRVIGMLAMLIIAELFLMHYLIFHLWLILINCTSYEYFQGRKKLSIMMSRKSFSNKHNHQQYHQHYHRHYNIADGNDLDDVVDDVVGEDQRKMMRQTFISHEVLHTGMSSTFAEENRSGQNRRNYSTGGKNDVYPMQQRKNHQYRQFYNKGVWNNILEVYSQSTSYSLREMKHRLPVQLTFKTR